MPRRHLAIPAVTGLLFAFAVVGCTAPAPSPTPTGFATEAEAFAAAEATYRAYIDASNAIDLSDPATFEPVFDLTGGDFNAASRETLSELHAEGAIYVGERSYFNPELLGTNGSTATLAICLNVSVLDVTDAQGNSLVSDERPDVQSLAVDVDLEAGHVTEVRPSEIAGRC